MIPDRLAAGCEVCPALHLVPATALGGVCPGCGRGALSPAELRRDPVPEALVPFAVDEAEVARQLAAFVAPVWFPTPELDPAVLAGRLQRVFWPHWLVDADTSGVWEAEVGFDYPVESSQEVLEGGTWKTRKVIETRQRWEPRGGRAARRYENVPVPGLRDGSRLEGHTGPIPLEITLPWEPGSLGSAVVRLPDLTEAEQWPIAVERLRERVGDDCRAAAGAQHLRELRLELRADAPRWTWLLAPAFVTWYADDAGRRHLLVVNGLTGQVGGARMASPARGRTAGLLAIASALVLGAIGVCLGLTGLVLWLLLPVAAVVLLAALGLGCAAIWPFVHPAGWNKAQTAFEVP